MVVESKFNIGDDVWFIRGNQATCCDVTGVGIFVEGNKEPKITYTVHYDHDYDESQVFATKEELLKSL